MTASWLALGSAGILAAIVSSLLVAALGLARRAPGALPRRFVAGMAAFAGESLAVFAVFSSELPEDRRFWLELTWTVSPLVCLTWALFVDALLHPPGTRRSRSRAVALGTIAVLAIAASLSVARWGAFDVAEVTGLFYAARLRPLGLLAAGVQLLTTVAIVGGLEMFFRSAARVTVWRSKYLVLGLAAIFLGRFYFLSQTLLFHVVMAAYLVSMTAMLAVGNIAVAASLIRERLRETELAVSQRIVYQSIGIGMLGLYLLIVGVLSWTLARLEIPETVFWTSLLVFISALGLAAMLLSEDIRWRVKRLIGRHVFHRKYDYREQWTRFTARLGSRVALDDVAPELLEAVTAAVGTAKGLLYIRDPRDSRFHLAAALEVRRPAPVVDEHSPLMSRMSTERRPLVIDGSPDVPPSFVQRGVAVPLHWLDTLTGVIFVGPERAGAPYTPEDFEFLETVGRQAAGMVVTARLSEAVAQSREFEAFSRLTSFVVHDIKNSISALSMLSQNALANFDDPEFQRDALKTLSRTVDRMKTLLSKLTTPAAAGDQAEKVDIATLTRETIEPLRGRALSVIAELAPVNPVQGNSDALRRVVENLVSNAAEALAGRDGVVTVKTYQDAGCAVLVVSDTGCGMSEEFVRTALFIPFRSTKQGGWGIGLYHTKTIVEAHHGILEVTTKEGMGTTFTVRLPSASS